MKELWIRLGVVIKITEAEEQAIFGDDEGKMRDALRLIIAEGRFCPDEETYIPSEAVQEFNHTYLIRYSIGKLLVSNRSFRQLLRFFLDQIFLCILTIQG